MVGHGQTNPFLRRAAILLTSLPEEDAAAVMRKLSPKQVETVSIEIARLGRLDKDEQEKVIYEFADANPHSLGFEAGDLNLAKSLVEKALGAKAGDTLENVQQQIEATPFQFLRTVDPQNLLTFINDEHPQTIALILSHCTPAYGAQVLSGLPADRQMAVIRRVANMKQTNPEVIQEVEHGLQNRMSSVMSQAYRQAGGIPSVAEILNVSDRATERALLENLAQEDPDLVEEIRRLMFVFEDLVKLTPKDLQSLSKEVDKEKWAMALKSASAELKDKVKASMSQRAAETLEEEMEYLGPVRLKEVEATQQQIVDIVRRLEDASIITIHAADEDDEFIT